MQFDTLHAFVVVVDAGSFAAAAAQTDTSRMTLSRRVASLEAELGQPLLKRSESGIAPTPTGVMLHHAASTLLADFSDALSVCRGGTQESMHGVLYYPSNLAPIALEIVLPRLLGAGSVSSVRCQEGPPPTPLPPKTAALVFAKVSPGPRAVDVGPVCCGLAAATAYLESTGTPKDLRALTGHRVVAVAGGPPWPLRDGGELPCAPSVVVSGAAGVRQAVLAGTGLGLLWWTGDSLAEGLVPVLAGAVGAAGRAWVIGESTLLDALVG